MSQKSPKPPAPIVFFLALVAVVGVFLLFLDGSGAHFAGFAMIGIGVVGIIVHRLTAKPQAHASLPTSGADRGTHRRK